MLYVVFFYFSDALSGFTPSNDCVIYNQKLSLNASGLTNLQRSELKKKRYFKMKITQTVNVYRVGYGDIQDEKTGLITPWAKVYALGDEPSDNNGIYGLPYNDYAVLDKDGQPDQQLAKRILAELGSQNITSPLPIEFDFALKSSGKKQVLAIIGMPSKSGVKQPAAKAS